MKPRIYIWIILVILGTEPVFASFTEQPVVVQSTQHSISKEQPKKTLSLFFIIGIIINIVMFSVVIIWAVKEWRKTDL